MDFSIPINMDNSPNSPDSNQMDDDDHVIPPGQKQRSEMEIANDTVRDIKSLNKRRYPLLTLVKLLYWNSIKRTK